MALMKELAESSRCIKALLAVQKENIADQTYTKTSYQVSANIAFAYFFVPRYIKISLVRNLSLPLHTSSTSRFPLGDFPVTITKS